jgi:hypothetical protein
MPQLQLEDIASVLALAKTAKIDASDGLAVGQLIERVEMALVFAKVQVSASDIQKPGPATPADPKRETSAPDVGATTG